eukprot:1158161-Pelagomonas_calceolata.AAC.4
MGLGGYALACAADGPCGAWVGIRTSGWNVEGEAEERDPGGAMHSIFCSARRCRALALATK